MRKKRELKKQLTLAYSIGVIFLTIVSSAFISYVAFERERTAYIDYGKSVSDSLVSQMSGSFSGSLEELLNYSFSSYSEFSGVQKILIFDKNFKELFSAKRKKDYPVISGWQGLNAKNSRLERETEDAFYFTARLVSSTNDLVDGYLMLIIEKPSMMAYLKKSFLTNAGIMVFFALILLLVLGLVVRSLTKPLEKLSSIMIQAASGETGLRTHHDASAELGQMSEAFNQMMEILEKRREELEQSRDQAVQTAKIKSDFAANVSHEIRTPLF